MAKIMFIEKFKSVGSYRQPQINMQIHHGIFFLFSVNSFFVVIIIRFAGRGISNVSIISYKENNYSTVIGEHNENLKDFL